MLSAINDMDVTTRLQSIDRGLKENPSTSCERRQYIRRSSAGHGARAPAQRFVAGDRTLRIAPADSTGSQALSAGPLYGTGTVRAHILLAILPLVHFTKRPREPES
jgi:hypothetical protein